MKQNPDALYTHTQHGSAVKKKRTPKNANYKVMYMEIIKSHIFFLGCRFFVLIVWAVHCKQPSEQAFAPQ